MAWARISDDFIDHPKVAGLTVDLEGMAALGLWTSALIWARADRRRGGTVPTGIAIRLSAGAGIKLASRLVAARLWDEVDGGYHFHDYEDVYTPGDLSEKRSAAGRSGGKASGRTRAATAAAKPVEPESKQVASSKSGTKRTASGPSSASLFDDDDPLTGGSAPLNSGSKDEATCFKVASVTEAKPREASRTRAGATTHYPEASNEASPSSPSAEAGDEKAETPGQRVNRITRTYTDVVKLSNFLPVQQIVKQAIGTGDYTEEQILDGLAELARKRDVVTKTTLRFAIEGLPERMSSDRHINGGGYRAQKVNHDEPGQHKASWDRRRANAQQQQ